MRKKLIFLLILLLTWSCFKFKESPLDPTTPTGMILKLLKDQRKIFVTSNAFQGNIGGGAGVPDTIGIQRADFICNNDANKPDNNTYKAMIVDEITNRRACSTSNCMNPNENVDWVFKPNTDYYRPNGRYLFTTNSAGIVTTNIAESILAGSYYPYWTGLASDWTISPSAHCNNWTDNSSSYIGRVGSSNSKDSKWYSDISSPSCDSSKALLCVGQ
jgi:hypothetical protein